jgi:hypothetical protein
MERRLAAILAADVVGYSRLMGADEAGTLSGGKQHEHQNAGGSRESRSDQNADFRRDPLLADGRPMLACKRS